MAIRVSLEMSDRSLLYDVGPQVLVSIHHGSWNGPYSMSRGCAGLRTVSRKLTATFVG